MEEDEDEQATSIRGRLLMLVNKIKGQAHKTEEPTDKEQATPCEKVVFLLIFVRRVQLVQPSTTALKHRGLCDLEVSFLIGSKLWIQAFFMHTLVHMATSSILEPDREVFVSFSMQLVQYCYQLRLLSQNIPSFPKTFCSLQCLSPRFALAFCLCSLLKERIKKRTLFFCTSSTLSLASICLLVSCGLCHWVAVISISISFQFYYGNIWSRVAEKL